MSSGVGVRVAHLDQQIAFLRAIMRRIGLCTRRFAPRARHQARRRRRAAPAAPSSRSHRDMARRARLRRAPSAPVSRILVGCRSTDRVRRTYPSTSDISCPGTRFQYATSRRRRCHAGSRSCFAMRQDELGSSTRRSGRNDGEGTTCDTAGSDGPWPWPPSSRMAPSRSSSGNQNGDQRA